jgi:hypothetical protein
MGQNRHKLTRLVTTCASTTTNPLACVCLLYRSIVLIDVKFLHSSRWNLDYEANVLLGIKLRIL